jgi:hypothetical protein
MASRGDLLYRIPPSCSRNVQGTVSNLLVKYDCHLANVHKIHTFITNTYTDSLRAGRIGNQISLGFRFSTPVQTGPWSPPSLLYSGHRVSFLGVKAAEAWRSLPTLSSAEVKERVEVHPYAPSGFSWPVLGGTLPTVLVDTVQYLDEEENARDLRFEAFTTVLLNT